MKNKPFLRSMRARMTVSFAAAIALLMTFTCCGMTLYLHHVQRRSLDNLLDHSIREVDAELHHLLKNTSDPAVLMEEEGEEMRDRDLVLLVVDASSHVLAQSQKTIPSWPHHGKGWLVRTIPFGKQGGKAVLAAQLQETREELREFALALGGISILVVSFSALAAWALVGRTLSPIGALSRQAATASDHLLVQLEAPSNDAEVTGLVDTLNDFLSRQAQAVQAKGRFYAAASHELRTPLQALSGFLEMGLSRQRSNDDLRATVLEAQEQSRQLVELVQELLLLNQLDMATSLPPQEEIDVPDVSERILKQLAGEVEKRNLTVETDWTTAIEISAPWHHVEMLVRNLLENAVKYATPGSTVQVRQVQHTLSFWNQCAPIAGWDENKYFEPFYRPDSSRTSSTGGNGLGLAITKAICDANDWQVTIQQTPAGVLVQVTFNTSPPVTQ